MGFLCIAKQTIPTLLPLKVYNNNSVLVSIGSVLNVSVSILLEFGCVRNTALMRLCVMVSVFRVSMFHAKCSYKSLSPVLLVLFDVFSWSLLSRLHQWGVHRHILLPCSILHECLSFKTVGCRLTCKHVGVLTAFFLSFFWWDLKNGLVIF